MVDYSKWGKIEVSDDEDETHPNIDTPSLFRWRHQARIEKEEELKAKKKLLEEAEKEIVLKEKEIKSKLNNPEASNADCLKEELEKLQKASAQLKIKEQELKKEEKLQPWNVDTLSQPKFSKTIINKKIEKTYDEMTDEEKEAHMKKFIKENEKLIKQYGMLRRFDDSKEFLTKNNLLVHEDTANYLVVWCINLEIEGKRELMTHVAHQCICMQYMLELSKQLKLDPRGCIGPFFERIQIADPVYKAQFEDEIAAFITRIEKRAKEKIAEAEREVEEEEELSREKRLGPGGLDPVEVFESLPKELQDCFESRDPELLQRTIAAMKPEEARYHMKRCVDSGMWIADARANEYGLVSDDVAAEEEEKTDEDPVYASIDKKDELDLD